MPMRFKWFYHQRPRKLDLNSVSIFYTVARILTTHLAQLNLSG